MGTITKEQKVERLKKLFTLEEICAILGHYEGIATDEEIEKLEMLERDNPSEFERLMYEEAADNGNFEECIDYEAKLPI